MKTFVSLAHTREIEYQRAVFSILSFSAWNDNNDKIRYILYTDNKEYFTKYFQHLNIEFVELNMRTIKEWMGPDQYVHRLKIKSMLDSFTKYNNDDLFFMDSDTFTYNSVEGWLDKFADGKALMYAKEYSFEEAKLWGSTSVKDFEPEINNKTYIINNNEYSFKTNQYSWNSGVIGLSSTDCNLLRDVLEISDIFYKNTKVFFVEQYSFSLIFQTRILLDGSTEFIHHYFSKKKYIDKYVLKFNKDILSYNLISEKKDFIKKYTSDLNAIVQANPNWDELPKIKDKVNLFFKRNGDISLIKDVLYIIKIKLKKYL
ncbi:hypothetical protein GCM10027346_12170 [Hymenobacter seoulensis]